MKVSFMSVPRPVSLLRRLRSTLSMNTVTPGLLTVDTMSLTMEREAEVDDCVLCNARPAALAEDTLTVSSKNSVMVPSFTSRVNDSNTGGFMSSVNLSTPCAVCESIASA